MPRLNKKGPAGDGPRTGRQMGRCVSENKGLTEDEVFRNRQAAFGPGQGKGLGLGFGPGLGRRGGRGRGLGLRFRGNQ